MEHRRPTLREVASLAGVSHQTVSRYLRHEGGLRDKTVEQVEAAISELGYRPNLVARSMRTRQTGLLAIVLPGWAGAERTMAAASEEARAAGYRVEVVIAVGEDPAALGTHARDLLAAGLVDGVLSVTPIPPAPPDDELLVQVGEYDTLLRAVDAVADDTTTMEDLVEKLAGMGHRHLLHIGGPEDWLSARLRLEGYRNAVARLGLVSHGELPGPWLPARGLEVVSALPEDSPVTAVVAASDHIAIGAVRAALQRGWSVPERLSVTGWDDLWLARFVTPALSTVVVDRESAGRHSMRRLIAAVRGEPEPEPPSGPLTQITFRETTAPPADQAP
ncbi:LacI family DNA-binding transcriptional regulator [Ruania zhangjianzhongii]|uniref:LacI family DNA-binding transcriptional regulator n=1 Tax=Ruania zhangjianzhongii TaxID=2603206 RepID=UPI001F34325D|nr:LacI family DNA-binding transcriptional regulator [Ruania zhangjianzhongii]